MPSNPQIQPPAASPAQPEALPRLDTRQLFRGQKTVEIDHGDQRYTLRVTRDNKLILTK